jgi:hypothetical protein
MSNPGEEKRTSGTDRRQHDDRRKQAVPISGADRRKGQRRTDKDRRAKGG